MIFQPTSPVRETTGNGAAWPVRIKDFNPRPPCGRRPPRDSRGGQVRDISTHVPRAGDDVLPVCGRCTGKNFNPRPPCGRRPGPAVQPAGARYHFNPRPPCGRRPVMWWYRSMYQYFNPRPPCGRRLWDTGRKYGRCYFNPRPPCGRRPADVTRLEDSIKISPHVPRA